MLVTCPDCNNEADDFEKHIWTCPPALQRSKRKNKTLEDNEYKFLDCDNCGNTINYPSGSESLARYIFTRLCINCQEESNLDLISIHKKIKNNSIKEFEELIKELRKVKKT